MRVLHVTPYFAPAFRYGGPPRSILGLCRALVDAGVEVEVFTTTANGPEPLPAAPEGTEYEGVRVRYFPLAWPQRYWRASGLGAALERALPGSRSRSRARSLEHDRLDGRRAARAPPAARTSSRRAACCSRRRCGVIVR